jgi:hypothetical protein
MTPTRITHGRVLAVAVAMFLGLAWSPPAAAKIELTVEVASSDAQDLYAKLADPQYAGHTLLLSGTYLLTPEGNGAATRGYIELGDRSLLGTNVMRLDSDSIPVDVDREHFAETTIDGSALPSEDEPVLSSYVTLFPRTRALIRAPLGNSVEGVTLIWPRSEGPGGAIRIVGGQGARVARCRVDVGGIGIFINNPGKEGEGARVTAELSDNVVVHGGAFPGILITNLVTRNAHLEVLVSGNRVEANGGTGAHVRIQNQHSQDSTIDVVSTRNRFTTGATAVIVFGGNALFFPAFPAASGNRTDVTSVQDTLEANATGLAVRGGSVAGDDNLASVTLEGTRFEANSARTIDAIGREGQGDGNQARLVVRGAVYLSGGPFRAAHEVGTLSETNTLAVSGNAQAWERTNGELPPPDPSFFTGR